MPQSYIEMALKANVDWRKNGVVVTPSGQTGGNCGTWARVGCAESQYALGGGGSRWPHGRAKNPLTAFSEQ